MNSKSIKEPIRKKWIWIGLVLIVLANVPWYFPVGDIYPLVFGLPYWALIILVASLVLSGYLYWVTLTQWNLVEDEEEREQREGGTAE